MDRQNICYHEREVPDGWFEHDRGWLVCKNCGTPVKYVVVYRDGNLVLRIMRDHP
jgi:hypothetical protein